jgi:hypothetical protein
MYAHMYTLLVQASFHQETCAIQGHTYMHACIHTQASCHQETYVAQDHACIHINTHMHRQAAIKKLMLSKTTDLPALQNEIAMMRTSAHPNVVEYMER